MKDMDFQIENINRVIRRKPNPDWYMDKILYTKEYNAVIVLDGRADYVIGNKRISVSKNDIIIFPPGIVRSGYADKITPWEFITINFNMEFNDEGIEFFSKNYLLFKNTGVGYRSKFLDIAYIWEGKNPLYLVKCRCLMYEILYDLIRSTLPQNQLPHADILEATRTYIQANFRNKINIEDLADRMGLSVSYFRKLFTKAYGQSPQQYIITLRINTAYDLLESGEVNVTEAAELSGFEDIYYFSALFKKQTGVSPSKVLQSSSPIN